MNFEQIRDKNRIKGLVRERTFLTRKLKRTTQQLKRTEQNIETLKNELVQCEEEIISLANQDNNRSETIKLASEMPTQILDFSDYYFRA
jgi:septal ring factor EnvC (AmiA/AmiB activator)